MRRPRFLDNMESLSKLPIVELSGTNRVLIENHVGVAAYSLNEIQIKVSYGKLSVTGANLKLKQLNKEQLVIIGNIDKIQLFRR